MSTPDPRWAQVEAFLQQKFGKLPDMEGILFLVGMNELDRFPHRYKFTKEEKQDIMHIAVCSLLAPDGYFEFTGRDADGWPHYVSLKPVAQQGLASQETLLQSAVARYFVAQGYIEA